MDSGEYQAKALDVFALSMSNALYGRHWGDPKLDPVFKWLPEHVPAILEIGAGGGRWTRYLSGRCDRLYICEGTKSSLSLINRKFPKIDIKRFMVCPDGKIPQPDASMDFVIACDTFVHFEPSLFESYFRSIGRVLKPGGMFLVQYAKKVEGLEEGFTHYCEEDWVLDLASECGLVRAKDPFIGKRGFGKQTELFMAPPF